MPIDLFLVLQRAVPAAQQPRESTIVQAVLLGLAITFVFSVFAAGFTVALKAG